MRQAILPLLAVLAIVPLPEARASAPTTVLPNGRHLEPAGRTLKLGNLPFSCALSPDGTQLAVLHGGKSDHALMLYDTREATLSQTIPLTDAFHGLAWATDGMLWVSGGTGHVLHRFQLKQGKLEPLNSWACPGYPAGVAVSEHQVLVADNTGDRLEVLPLDGTATRSVPLPPTPFAVFAAASGPFLATSWGAPLLTVLEGQGKSRTVRVGTHPTAIAQSPSSHEVVVANANDDTLSVLSPPFRQVAHTVALSAYPGAPLGATPTALAFAPDGRRLYVALSGLNAIAVLDPRTWRELGRIPTAWYPSGLAVAPDGRQLYAICAKGYGAGPRTGDRPGWLLDGTLQVIPTPDALTLRAMTRRVSELNGFAAPAAGPASLPPIAHVVYVVRENRTYDQVMGDLPAGDGDPRLTLYGREVTPNLHALAERFAFGDRFFCDGEISAQGHQWTQGAVSTDAVERLWPPVYANRGRWVDADDPLVYPMSDYLLDRCVKRGVSARMYGDYLRKGPDGQVLANLRGLRSPTYRGWDLNTSDLDRIVAWQAEFRSGIFPAFSYLWLPNDHTAGTRPLSLTPRAMVAQNDLATGQLVDILSHDPRWAHTLVMIQEDDAQSGFDHVDGHRSVLVLASPWIKGGSIATAHYSQTSLVATVTALLKLGHLTQYDARSPILDGVWSTTPDLRPYTAIVPPVSLTERNTPAAPMASQSLSFDLRVPDAGDQAKMARILWQAERLRRGN